MRTDWWICRYVPIDMVELRLSTFIHFVFYILVFLFTFTSLSIYLGMFLGYSLLQVCQYFVSGLSLVKRYVKDRRRTNPPTTQMSEEVIH